MTLAPHVHVKKKKRKRRGITKMEIVHLGFSTPSHHDDT
jgi:hypothetical protein